MISFSGCTTHFCFDPFYIVDFHSALTLSVYQLHPRLLGEIILCGWVGRGGFWGGWVGAAGYKGARDLREGVSGLPNSEGSPGGFLEK